MSGGKQFVKSVGVPNRHERVAHDGTVVDGEKEYMRMELSCMRKASFSLG